MIDEDIFVFCIFVWINKADNQTDDFPTHRHETTSLQEKKLEGIGQEGGKVEKKTRGKEREEITRIPTPKITMQSNRKMEVIDERRKGRR